MKSYCSACARLIRRGRGDLTAEQLRTHMMDGTLARVVSVPFGFVLAKVSAMRVYEDGYACDAEAEPTF